LRLFGVGQNRTGLEMRRSAGDATLRPGLRAEGVQGDGGADDWSAHVAASPRRCMLRVMLRCNVSCCAATGPPTTPSPSYSPTTPSPSYSPTTRAPTFCNAQACTNNGICRSELGGCWCNLPWGGERCDQRRGQEPKSTRVMLPVSSASAVLQTIDLDMGVKLSVSLPPSNHTAPVLFFACKSSASADCETDMLNAAKAIPSVDFADKAGAKPHIASGPQQFTCGSTAIGYAFTASQSADASGVASYSISLYYEGVPTAIVSLSSVGGNASACSMMHFDVGDVWLKVRRATPRARHVTCAIINMQHEACGMRRTTWSQ
jgi:hypothetical protein